MNHRALIASFSIALAASSAQALPTPTTGAPLAFPRGFVWGTATAAVQVEGDTPDSDWADFETRPGAIRGGHRIGKAARHFELYEADFREAAAMHTRGYRFSIEWSRLEPSRGAWNAEAVRHYRRMLLSLRAKGLRPLVTLHHFSNPRWVARQGGWENPATIADFDAFTRRAAVAFGDLVDDWITFNEPTIYASEGYVSGRFPPGKLNDLGTLPRVLGHLALAHGRAYRTLHRLDTRSATPERPPARVGVAEHMLAFYPATPWSPLDWFWTGVTEGWVNYGFLDAATTGRVRFETIVNRYWRDEPGLAGTLDFVGVNYYTRSMVNAFAPLGRHSAPGALLSDLGLEVHPEGLTEVLRRSHARYGLPILVTETGVADARRQATPGFMVRHAAELHRAIAEGVPVEGLYWWSLMDNFEWQNGYYGRFGLLAVDFDHPARPRTWTPGAHLYARLARSNRLDADLLAKYAPGYSPPTKLATP